MSIRKTRWLLRGAAMVLLLSSVAIVSWAFQSPAVVEDRSHDLAQARRARTPRTKLIGSPPLDDLARVWSKELQRPLFEPPPATSKQPKRKERKDPAKQRRRGRLAEGGVRLVGTMLEDGRSKAVFMDSSGRIDVKGDGETLRLAPEIRVDRIELTQVTISNRGRPMTLQLPITRAP